MELKDLLELIIEYFNIYGYWILFFGLLLENTVFLGLVVPGETVLLAASFFAAQESFNIYIVILIGCFSAIIGNIIGYFLGVKGGRPLLEKYGKFFLISEKRIIWAENYFDGRGGETVFFGRFVSGIRVFVPFLAGAARMKFNIFIIYTILAVLIWTIGLSLLGYFFGANIELLKKIIDTIGWTLFILIILIILLIWFINNFRKRKKYAD